MSTPLRMYSSTNEQRGSWFDELTTSVGRSGRRGPPGSFEPLAEREHAGERDRQLAANRRLADECAHGGELDAVELFVGEHQRRQFAERRGRVGTAEQHRNIGLVECGEVFEQGDLAVREIHSTADRKSVV